MQLLRRTLQRGVVSVAWCTVAVVLTLAAASLAARAQGTVRRNAPPFWHAWELSVGFGAEYSVKTKTPPKHWLTDCEFRLAIVGARIIAGREWYWLEASGHLPGKKESLVNKVLFTVDTGRAAFSRGVALVPGHPPMALPQEWLWSWAQGDLQAASGYIHTPRGKTTGVWYNGPWSDPDNWWGVGSVGGRGYFSGLRMANVQYLEMPRADDLGPAVVTTPAGTFHCEHWSFRHHGGDVWVSPGAGPFGIVKAASRDVTVGPAGNRISASLTTMVLTREVTKAEDAIAGKPLTPDPGNLWHWIWEQRYALVVTVPYLGLPEPAF